MIDGVRVSSLESSTHQHPLYPAELDHSFGLGRVLCRGLLGRGQLLAVGEAVFEGFLTKSNVLLGQKQTAAGDIQARSQTENGANPTGVSGCQENSS